MQSADVTALTTAFDLQTLVDGFVLVAPYILGGLGIVIVMGAIFGIVRKVRGSLKPRV